MIRKASRGAAAAKGTAEKEGRNREQGCAGHLGGAAGFAAVIPARETGMQEIIFGKMPAMGGAPIWEAAFWCAWF